MITRKESETAQCISIPSRYLHKAPLTPQKSKSMQILTNINALKRKNELIAFYIIKKEHFDQTMCNVGATKIGP